MDPKKSIEFARLSSEKDKIKKALKNLNTCLDKFDSTPMHEITLRLISGYEEELLYVEKKLNNFKLLKKDRC